MPTVRGGHPGEQLLGALPGCLPAADLVPVVGLAHSAERGDIFPEDITLAAGQMIVVQHVLHRRDRIIQFALIELAVAPVFGEFAELVFRVVESVPIAAGEAPDPVTMIQVFVHPIDKRINPVRVIGSTGWTVLSVREEGQSGGQKTDINQTSHCCVLLLEHTIPQLKRRRLFLLCGQLCCQPPPKAL